MSTNEIDSRRAKLSDAQRAELERRLRGARTGTSAVVGNDTSIPLCNRAEPIPLSHAQRSLWLTWRMDPTSPAYNMAGALTLKGVLDPAALHKALQALVQRHEILRTVYPAAEDGEPIQRILPTLVLALRDVDLTTIERATAQQTLRDLLAQFAAEPFSLEQEVPFRTILYRLHENEHVLGLSLHHIAGDGWSIGILVNELFSLYQAITSGQPSQLSALPIQFADYAVWQRAEFNAGERERQTGYWRARLGTDHAPLALPLKQSREAASDAREARHVFQLSPDLSERLRDLARSHGTTLYIVMVSLLKLTLYRFSGEHSIRVGTPVANRQKAETHGIIGYLLNLQVLQTHLAPAQRFTDLLAQVRETVIEAQSHQDLPFDMLVDALQPERLPGVHPLIQVKCTQQEDMSRPRLVAGLEVSVETVTNGRVHFDLSLDFTNAEEGIRCVLIYAEALFDETTVRCVAAVLEGLAEQVTRFPEGTLAALELPVATSNVSGASQRFESTDVLQMWARAGQRDAAAVAVRDEVTSLTFTQLDQQSDRLALALVEQGVGPEVRVGLHADRSCEFVVGVLAVLKAGGAYVPLDPALPVDRLRYQLKDSGARLLLSKTDLSWDPDMPVMPLNTALHMHSASRPPQVHVHREQAAYVIYTSGSTGNPKGVVVSHGALANYVQAVMQRLEPTDDVSSMAMVSTVAADLGHTVLFGALCSGRTLHLISAERAFDPDAFSGYMSRHRVDVLKIVPSHLQALLSAGSPADVLPARRLVLGGEATPWPLLDRIASLKPGCRVLNHYGPTETTVGVLTQEAGNAARTAGTLPVGAPLANSHACVLDADLNPVPKGVAGELYLGGAGAARGYQAQAAQTSERFIASPFREGKRLYRTGDRVKMLEDSSLEFLGRVDDQVKVRGYRVELREVAQALRAHPGIVEAEVIARQDAEGRTQLHGYAVAPAGEKIDVAKVRDTLARLLPDYMLPAAIVQLDALPLTANGKVDRKALPEPVERAARRFEAPEGDVESVLADVWQQVLKVDQVGRHDNFFELGGDSILTLQIVARARKRGLRFSPKALMEGQTVAAVAAVATLDAKAATGTSPAPTVPANTDAFAPTPVQAWFFEQAFQDSHHWNQSLLLSATEAIEPAQVQQAVELLVAHHDALRLRFDRSADGRWSQTPQPVGQAVFERIDLSLERDVAAAVTTAADRVQQSLSLQTPFKAAWMDLGTGRAGRLLLVAHHLVIDGVSWRVILEDLQTVYRQLREGRSPELPPATTSFRDWSGALARHANSSELIAEQAFWQTLVGRTEPPLPGHAEGSNTVANARTIATSLDEIRTEQLLADVPQAYRTRIDDVLLTALARTLCAWDGRDSVLVELEGHGREGHIGERIDLSRTVGWFTTLYPVRLAPRGVGREKEDSLGGSLKAIKEQLRQVPHKGLGYGVLRYLSPEGRALADGAYPQVTFNYLGQLDQSFNADSAWRLARESAGQERAPGSRRRTWLGLDADVHRGELRVRWTYSTAVHDAATVEGLAKRFIEELQGLIEHCLTSARGVTPSDFPLAGLCQDQLDHLPLAWDRLADLYPLAPMQAGMLFHSMLEPEGTAYVNQLRLDLENLDVSRFKAAWQVLLDRHDVLRTGFVQGETPLQWVARSVEVPLVEHDWRDRTELSASLDTLARTEFERGFDLTAPPLMRLVLVQCSAGRHHFIWTRHHLLLDGWSSARLLAELLARHAGETTPSPRGRYRDYIAWLQQRDAAAAEQYWRTLVGGLEEPSRLASTLKLSPGGESHHEHVQVFDTEETARMGDFIRAQRVTLNTLVQAAWALLLQRYTGQASVSFGATTSGRPADLPDANDMLGLFINTLPVITQVRPAQAVGDWLRELQTQNIASREHEHTPLVEIQRWAGVSGHGLFDSILVFENYPVDKALRQQSGTLRVSVNANREETNYPITVTVLPGNALTISFVFKGDGLSTELAERLAEHYAGALRAMLRAPEGTLGEIDLLGETERQQLTAWGVNHHRYESPQPVHRLIEQQVRSNPDAVALWFGEEQLSYGELNARANRLAHRLIALGVRAETKVGIAVERSIEMVVGLLAILKAGGAYVPLDPEYPIDRLAYMVEDSGIGLLLTQSWIKEQLPSGEGIHVLELDTLDLNSQSAQDPNVSGRGENLAYVIYTSGSTGRPKGVGIPHQCLAEHAQVAVGYSRLTAEDRMLQFATLNFDGCIEQLFPPLLVGASIVLRGPMLWDSTTFYQELIDKQISVADLTTAYWLLLVQDFVRNGHRNYGALRQVHVGGEAMPPQGLKAWRDAGLGKLKLLNTYGPTEATVTASILDCDPYVSEAVPLPQQMPIGVPLAGRALYVMDADLSPVPQGVAGELCIGGALLARGYLGRAELSAERFIADPFNKNGGRLYRTGDLVRWNADGQLEYLGRIDHQIKIRGLRIEMGEIEAQLMAQPAVREAIVVATSGESGPQLVGYVTPKAGQVIDAVLLRKDLAKKLPDYMVPSTIVTLDALPLNANGKVDRKMLPAPALDAAREYEPPQGEVEAVVAAIWAEVLGKEQVGRRDNFFELGGHSLLALAVLERMRTHGIAVQVRTLFQQPELASFVQALTQNDDLGNVVVPPNLIPAGCTSITPDMLTLIRLDPVELARVEAAVPGGATNIQDIYPLAPLQEGILFHHMLQQEGDIYVTPCLVSFDTRERLVRFVASLNRVIERHDILRTSVLWEGLREPVQVVWRHAHLEIEWLATAEFQGADSVAEQLTERVDPRYCRIDVRRAPMVRAVAGHDAGQGCWLLQLPSHHLILDHATLDLLVKEVALIQEGRDSELPEPVPFRRFVAQARLGVSQTEHKAFFTKMLGDVEEPTAPFGLLDVQGNGCSVEEARMPLDAELARQVRLQAQRYGVSAASLFHLAWALLLSKTTGKDDVVFGTVLFGRMQGGEGAERALGMFINTLPIRIRIGRQNVEHCLRQTHRALSELLHHEHAVLSLAQRCSALPASTPLFSALLNYRYSGNQGGEAGRPVLDGMQVLGGQERSNYPLDMSVDDLGEGFALVAQVVKHVGAQRLCEYMQISVQGLVDALTTQADRHVCDIELPGTVERQRLVQWGVNKQRYPYLVPVHRLIELQSQERPDAIAVLYDNESLTYQELNDRANRLAHRLLASGVKPDTRVGVALDRSIDMVVGLLAILKAGGAYVPLDPEYPSERLAFMVGDSSIELLLTHSWVKHRLPSNERLRLLELDALDLSSEPECNPQVAVHSESLAYVIYTSGSTGRPKSVGIPHRCLVEHAQVSVGFFGLTAADRMLQFATLNFDGCIEQLFPPLLVGASIVLRGPVLWDSATFYRELIAKQISVVDLTTAYWLLLVHDFVREGMTDYGVLRQVHVGGEAMPPEGLRAWRAAGLSEIRLLNTYGPTEATVTASVLDCDPYVNEARALPQQMPIGTPLAGRALRVMDSDLCAAPQGVAGELCIGGALLARGYLGRAALSAERFIADPFDESGSRLYRTGDLVRWNGEGQLEYLGRIDHQVKIRGLRIELGEIEAQMLAQPEVREAVVLAKEGPGGARLVGYVSTKAGQAIDAALLQERLNNQLPDYMVPGAILVLDALPLNANGKIDRKALPEPDFNKDQEYEAPLGEVENGLADVWRDVLCIPQVGRHDNFFELGGHSLSVLRLQKQLLKVFSVQLPLRAYFENPTLIRLAEVVSETMQASESASDIEQMAALMNLLET